MGFVADWCYLGWFNELHEDENGDDVLSWGIRWLVSTCVAVPPSSVGWLKKLNTYQRIITAIIQKYYAILYLFIHHKAVATNQVR